MTLKSFLFTLANPHNVRAQRLVLEPGEKRAIWCECDCASRLYDIGVSDALTTLDWKAKCST
jgi:hypothetical protein